jgi:hypothetical protein
VIEKSFLDQVPVHLGGCDRTGDRDQPLHAIPPGRLRRV